MKNYKSIIAGLAIAGAALTATSCNDILDLSPVDYYGSGNFWTTEAQVDGYICTLNSYLRNQCFNHCIMFGELRGGLYKTSSGSSDGSTHLNGDVMLQNFDADHTGVTNFGNYYGAITQTNLFITRVEAITFLPEAKKKHYLGIAYGIRAFLYFDLYRTYGAVPLRLDVKVIDGELDPTKLYMARNSPEEVMKQIKSDLDTSLGYFENAAFDPYGFGSKVVWSKAASEYLAGEVYLWNAKVDVSDINGTHKAEPADISKAKTYFENVINGGYGLSLQTNFADVFSTSNKGNSEIIFAIRYKEDEAGHAFASSYTYMSDGRGTLSTQVNADGTEFGDPLHQNGGGGQWYEYTNEFYNTYSDKDTRKRASFVPCYSKVEYQKGNLVLLSAPVGKNVGHVNSANVHVWDGDQPYFRLAGAYLALAEIANYNGNNQEVETYINIIRKRAYGADWGPEHEFKSNGNFEDNELAILFEKDKEFVQEGQRWWDLCRMTTRKGGDVTDHLAFSDKVSHTGAVLPKDKAYKLLWPLDKTILGNDTELKQTVGY